MTEGIRELAVVTGASSGIGLELARLCAKRGFDLVIASDEASITDAAYDLELEGVKAHGVEADLSTIDGVDRLCDAIGGRSVDYLLANAGHGLGKAFLDQDFAEARHVLDTNVTGTIYLVHRIARDMRLRRKGRILFTGSIAGFMPGAFQAVYNGTKAFIDSFSFALRNELKDSGVSVTCLMPGPTDTKFFERAHMKDTDVAQGSLSDPADVAQTGFDAMMDSDGHVVAGAKAKMQVMASHFLPDGMLAEMHRKLAEPGSGAKH